MARGRAAARGHQAVACVVIVLATLAAGCTSPSEPDPECGTYSFGLERARFAQSFLANGTQPEPQHAVVGLPDGLGADRLERDGQPLDAFVIEVVPTVMDNATVHFAATTLNGRALPFPGGELHVRPGDGAVSRTVFLTAADEPAHPEPLLLNLTFAPTWHNEPTANASAQALVTFQVRYGYRDWTGDC